MFWLLRTLTSSIGKKLVMALTGLCFSGFLCAHLLGNLTVYGGKGMFNAYAEHLLSYGVLLNAVEFGMIALALCHVFFGLWLFIGNLRSRPVRYAVRKNAGGRTWSSTIMPYSGLYLLTFVVIHVLTFRFADRNGNTLFDMVTAVFANPYYIIFYVFSVIVVGLHVRHGLWSAFQTLGANHPKYFPLIRSASLLFGFAAAIGFASIPLFLHLV
jgi:succinate dehydrogenase / fumarate reductase cytochrome b subunit